MEVVDVANDVFRMLSDAHWSHVRINSKVTSLKNLIDVFLEFMHCRINTHNMLATGLSNKIHATLKELQEDIQRYEKMTSGCSGKFFWLSAFGGSFWGSLRFLEKLTSYEQDITHFLTFVKIDLTSSTNDAIFHSHGIYRDPEETPKLFWRARFPDRTDVTTGVFCQALRGRTRCSIDVANHIASTLSTDGVVYASTFYACFKDPDELFDTKAWVKDRQMFGDSRTVLVPAHVNFITRITVHRDTVITASKDCTLKVFSINDTTIVLKCVMVGHEDSVRDFCVQSDTVFSGSSDCSIRTWEMEDGKQMRCYQVGLPIYNLSSLPGSSNVWVCSTREHAYPIIFYDITTSRIVKKIRLDALVINNFAIHNESIYVSDSRHITKIDLSGNVVLKHSCNKPVGVMYVFHMGVVFDTGKGVCLLRDGKTEEHIAFIESPSPLFRVYSIREFTGAIFVIWTYGSIPNHSKLTVIDYSNMSFQTHIIDPSIDKLLTNMAFYNNRVYFSTMSGNLCWYDRNNLHNNVCEGYTFNDQIVIGMGFSNVRIATCPSGIIVSNKNHLCVWNNDTGSIRSVELPFVAVDCVYSEGNVYIINGMSLNVYDMDLRLVNCYDSGWQLEKAVVSNHKIMVLYSEITRLSEDCNGQFSTKNIACFSKGEFIPIKGLCPNTVLFSTSNEVFLSDSNHITVIDANTLALNFKTDFSGHATGIAISGCILNERYYTLHSCNKVLVWTKGFVELSVIHKYVVHDSVVDIIDFSDHIIGFSTSGTIYVYNSSLALQKCIVSHKARVIYGTSYNDNKEVVVSDQNGVIKILAEIFSNK